MDLIDIQAMNPNDARKLSVETFVGAIFEGQTYSDVNLVKDEHGNNVELTETVRDAHGKVASSRIVTWTYYDAEKGIVNEIITEDGKERAIVKHTLDGKSPKLKKMLIAQLESDVLPSSERI